MENDTETVESAETAEEIDRILRGEVQLVKPRGTDLPKIKRIPTGKIVEAILDEAGVEMADQEREAISKITDEEAMKAFLEANLGTQPVVDEMKARSLFGKYLMQTMDHKAIGFATRYYNIRSTQECIEFARNLVNTPGATVEEKTNAGKLWLTANREFSVMLKRFVDMAQEMAPDNKPPKGVNSAPDIFAENAVVLVQQPSSS